MAQGQRATSGGWWWMALAAVCLVTLAVFVPGVTDGHLSADDWGYTYGCRFVKDGVSAGNVLSALTDPAHGAIWMPFTFFTYMCDISLGGGWMLHHTVNVLLHVLNAGLVFVFLGMLLRRFFGVRGGAVVWASAVGALVWSVHPMRAEAVVYVASRKDELWTLFALLGLMSWIRCFERGGRGAYVLTLACFLLSCMSKPTAVCFPLLAFVTQAALTGRLRCRLRPYLPMLAVSLAVGLLAVYSQAHPTGIEQADPFASGILWRLLNATVSLGLYLWHTVVTGGIHLDYRAVFGGWPVDGALGLAVLGVVVAGGLIACRICRRSDVRKALAFAGLWFAVGLLPTLGVFGYVNGDQAYADRYAYLPAIGLAFALACALLGLSRRSKSGGILLAFALVALATVAALPVIRSFENDFTAYSRTLERDPAHWRALRVIGNEYCARKGRMNEGVDMLRRSLRLHDSQRTADSLAYVLAIRGYMGDFKEVDRLGRAFAANPRLDVHGMMLDALAIVRMREEKYAEAVRLFQAALAAPRRSHMTRHAQLNLGLSLANMGRNQDALTVLGPLCRDTDRAVRARAAGAVAVIRSGCPRKPFVWK